MCQIFVTIFVTDYSALLTGQEAHIYWMLNVNLKCGALTSGPYQRDIRDYEQVSHGCLINTTCQEMEMSFVQISDVTFCELLMIRLIDANWEIPLAWFGTQGLVA